MESFISAVPPWTSPDRLVCGFLLAWVVVWFCLAGRQFVTAIRTKRKADFVVTLLYVYVVFIGGFGLARLAH